MFRPDAGSYQRRLKMQKGKTPPGMIDLDNTRAVKSTTRMWWNW